MVINDYPIHLA